MTIMTKKLCFIWPSGGRQREVSNRVITWQMVTAPDCVSFGWKGLVPRTLWTFLFGYFPGGEKLKFTENRGGFFTFSRMCRRWAVATCWWNKERTSPARLNGKWCGSSADDFHSMTDPVWAWLFRVTSKPQTRWRNRIRFQIHVHQN